MTKTHRSPSTRIHKRVVTTLGELISAAYDAADGFGRQRMERAAAILSDSPLARRLSVQLRFVR